MMTRLLNISMIIMVFLLLITGGAKGDIPQKINYEGRLTDPSGNSLNGSYNMRFTITSDAGGATVVWGPEVHAGVLVNSGVFSVSLGETTAIPASVFSSAARYLKIEVANPADSSNYEELAPATQIVAIGYAFKAADADLAQTVIDDAITASKISDEAVSESKLDALDSPANAEILSWNNAQGRFEWVSPGGTGTVTQVNTGTGLSGGPIINTGTISIDATVVTLSGSQTLTNKSLAAPTISGGTVNSSTIGGTTPATGTFTVVTAKTSLIAEDPGAGANTVTIQAPTLTGGYTLTLPTNDGDAGEVLNTDGAGNLSWGAIGSGTVNSGNQNEMAYYAAAGTAVSGLTTANNGVLVTDGTGVPSIASALPNAVQDNISRLGTITVGTWNGTALTNTYVADNLTVSGGAINNSVIGGTTPAAGSFTTITAKTSSMIEDPGAGTSTVAIQAPSLVSSYTLTLPADDGDAGEVLQTDGSGILSWTTVGGGDITAVGDVTSGAAFDGTQGNSLQFEGATPDINEITLVGADATIDRTITLPDASGNVILDSASQALTNKSIDADSNTIANIDNNEIKAAAGIDATKVGGGTVDNTEFGYLNGVGSSVVGISDTQSLTNKSIDADNNTITNIDNNEIKAAAGIDATKVAGGTVDNTEFGYLNGVGSAVVGVSDAQTLTNKTFTDASTYVQDNGDNTKKVQLEVSTVPAGETRSWAVGSGIPQSIEVFTSGGTWIRPAGVSKVYVQVWGGGGGGGSAAFNNSRGGGGGGGYSAGLVSVTGDVSVTVGTGGTADNNGGDSSFAGVTTITAAGGSGTSTAAGGAGGAGANGTINLTGGTGGSSQGGGDGYSGGTGGGSPMGGAGGAGGPGGNFGGASIAGTAGTPPGGGGGGGSEPGGTGGAGADGLVIISY